MRRPHAGKSFFLKNYLFLPPLPSDVDFSSQGQCVISGRGLALTLVYGTMRRALLWAGLQDFHLSEWKGERAATTVGSNAD